MDDSWARLKEARGPRPVPNPVVRDNDGCRFDSFDEDLTWIIERTAGTDGSGAGG